MGIIDLPGARLRFRRKSDDLTRESSWHRQDLRSVEEPRGVKAQDRPVVA